MRSRDSPALPRGNVLKSVKNGAAHRRASLVPFARRGFNHRVSLIRRLNRD